jgi:hypothetical protein
MGTKGRVLAWKRRGRVAAARKRGGRTAAAMRRRGRRMLQPLQHQQASERRQRPMRPRLPLRQPSRA